MIDIKVELSGTLAIQIANMSQKMTQDIDRTLLEIAIIIEGVVKKKISRGARSGLGYVRGRKRAVRSAPGEPPKSDTGRLVGSIRHEHDFLSASVGSDVNYAGYLELGTSKMANRPYLVPSLEENNNLIERMIMDAIQRAFE